MAAPNSQTSTVFLGGGTPVAVADDPTDKVSFYGTSGIAQRANAAQAVNALTTISSSVSVGNIFGFGTSAGYAALVAQVAEIAATLTALGAWKGGA